MITTWRATAERALIVAGLFLSFFVLPHEIISDAMVRYLALAELVEWHKVSPMAYSFIGPLFSAPLYLAGKLAMTPDWWCARFNTTVLAAGLLVMWLMTRGRIDAGLRRKFFLVLLAASMFPNHLRGYFTEVFSSVMVAVGLWAVRLGRPGLGWSAVTLGVANMPATLLGLTLATIRHVWDTRRLRHLLVIALTVALWLLESWMRRGHPTWTGYQGNHGPRTVLPYSGLTGFSYPLFFGLLSVFLSFGKGLLFFAPGLLLMPREWMSDELNGVHRLWLWFLAGMILVYASWWAWFGGWFWGPRFFLFACFPASLAIAVRLHQVDRLPVSAVATTLSVLTLSAWVGLSGAGFDQSDLIHSCTTELEFLCWYVPEFSALWYPFVTNWRPGTNAFVMMGYCGGVYLWLAAPLMRALVTKATPHLMRVVRDNASAGWRF
ncbi:MAG: hypothetical protein AUH43_10130 [Acidobacteria bacterium 13_1_40CM_65_14]|nr:MAG: hypothetical protein AUH43_10130 [Acidobacteria bacterium 13_1_40CM_65_14]